MNFKSDEWYVFGYEMGYITQICRYFSRLFQDVYGKSNRYSKLIRKFNANLLLLKYNLDDIICKSYPSQIIRLPGYEDLNITEVFYNINSKHANEFDYVDCANVNTHKNKCKYKNKICVKTKNDILNYIQIIVDYCNKTNTVFFNNNDKNIIKILGLMNTLQSLANNEMVFE